MTDDLDGQIKRYLDTPKITPIMPPSKDAIFDRIKLVVAAYGLSCEIKEVASAVPFVFPIEVHTPGMVLPPAGQRAIQDVLDRMVPVTWCMRVTYLAVHDRERWAVKYLTLHVTEVDLAGGAPRLEDGSVPGQSAARGPRDFVCQDCGNVHAILHGARPLRCKCGCETFGELTATP